MGMIYAGGVGCGAVAYCAEMVRGAARSKHTVPPRPVLPVGAAGSRVNCLAKDQCKELGSLARPCGRLLPLADIGPAHFVGGAALLGGCESAKKTLLEIGAREKARNRLAKTGMSLGARRDLELCLLHSSAGIEKQFRAAAAAGRSLGDLRGQSGALRTKVEADAL